MKKFRKKHTKKDAGTKALHPFLLLDDSKHQLKISSSGDIIDPKKESAKTDSQKIIFFIHYKLNYKTTYLPQYKKHTNI